MATYYWVGGSGTWDASTTTHWSFASALSFTASCSGTTLTTTGSPVLVIGMTVWSNAGTSLGTITGGSGNSWTVSIGGTYTSQTMSAATVGVVPLSTDNVIFNATSGLVGYTVTVGTNAVCNNITVSSPTSGIAAFSLAATSILSISGNMDMAGATSSTCTWTGASGARLDFVATTTGKTIQTNGIPLITVGSGNELRFNGTGGWILNGPISVPTLNILQGTFDSGNYGITCSINYTSIGAATRAINLGTSTVNVSGTVQFGGTGLTFSGSSSILNLSNSGANLINSTGSSITFGVVNITNTNLSTWNITGDINYTTLNISGRNTTGIGTINIGGNQTISGTLTINSASTNPTMRVFITSDIIGTPRTFSAGTLSAQYSDFRNITATGTATWSGTSFGNCLGNSGITFTAAKTVYWNLTGTQSWSANGWTNSANGIPASGGSLFPLAQDTAYFTNSGAAGTVVLDAQWQLPTVSFDDGVSPRTTSVSLNFFSSVTFYGDFICTSAVSFITGTSTSTFASQGFTKTITCTNQTFLQSLILNAPLGTLLFGSNITLDSTRAFTLTNGTLNLNNFNLTTGTFSSINTNTRTLAFGSAGILTLTGSSAVVINVPTADLFTSTGSKTVNLTGTPSTGTRSITFGNTSGSTESNVLDIYVKGGTDTVAVNRACRTLDCTGFSGSVTMSQAFWDVYGDLILPSTTSFSFPNYLTFKSTSTTVRKIDFGTGNRTLSPLTLTVDGANGIFQVQNSLTITNGLMQLNNGTFDLNGKTLTIGQFQTNAGTKILLLNGGTLNLSNTTSTAFYNFAPAGFTVPAGIAIGTISMTGATAKTFIGGSMTYSCYLNQGGAGTLTITGSNSFVGLTNTNATASSITLTSNTTQTLTAGQGQYALKLIGTSGNVISINTTSLTAAITRSGTGYVACDYLSVSNVTSTATTYAGPAPNSSLSGTTTGWSLAYNPNLRYWIGGSGTWDGSIQTNWAVLPGYPGGQTVPGTSTDVIFDTTAGTTPAVTITSASCRDIWVTATSPIAFSIGTTNTATVNGSMILATSSCTWTGTSGAAINFTATSTGQTLITNGISLISSGANNALNFSGTGGGWTLGSALTTNTINITAGTFDTGGYAVTCASNITISGATSKTINLNGSTVTLSGGTASRFNIASLGGGLFNAGTSTINFTGGSGRLDNTSGLSVTFYNVYWTSSSLTDSTYGSFSRITGNNTFNNVTLGPFSSSGESWFSLGGDQIINGTFTCNWTPNTTNPTARATITTDTVGTTRTITAAVVNIAKTSFRYITGAGTGSWNGTTYLWGDCGGNIGLTFPPGVSKYWTSGSNNYESGWSLTRTGTASGNNCPLPQDICYVTDDGSIAGITISMTGNRNWGGLSFNDGISPRTKSVTLSVSGSATAFYRDVTLVGPSILTLSNPSNGGLSLGSPTTQNFTSAGQTLPYNVDVRNSTGTVVLNDNVMVNVAKTFTLTIGTLNLNDFSLTTGIFNSDSSNTRTIAFGAGRIDLSGTGNITIWNANTATALTVTGTRLVRLTNTTATSATTRTISHAQVGRTEANAVSFYVLGGADTVATTANCSFLDLDTATGTFSGTFLMSGASSRYIYGSFALGNATTFTFTSTLQFLSTSATVRSVDTKGKALGCQMFFSGTGGSWKLLSDVTTNTYTTSYAGVITAGNLDLNGYKFSAYAFLVDTGSAKTITFNGGTIEATNAMGTTAFFNNDVPNTNFIAGSGIGRISLTRATAKTFVGGGADYSGCKIDQGGAGDLTITGNNTFADITASYYPSVINLPANGTTTVGTLTLKGYGTNKVSLHSSTQNTKTTLISSGNNEILLNNISLRDITATTTGNIRWRAPVNLGNINETSTAGNVNWNFGSFLPGGLFSFF